MTVVPHGFEHAVSLTVLVKRWTVSLLLQDIASSTQGLVLPFWWWVRCPLSGLTFSFEYFMII